MIIKETENKDKNDEVSGYVPVKLKRILVDNTTEFLSGIVDYEFNERRVE